MADELRPEQARVDIIQSLDVVLANPQWTDYHDLCNRIRELVEKWSPDDTDEARAPALVLYGELFRRLLKDMIAGGAPHGTAPRRSNRKIQALSFPNGLLPVPNILNHGTRHLGQMLSGGAEWTTDPEHQAMLATINGRTVGMIEFGIGGEDEAGRIIDALGPRSLKCMVAISGLIYDKTRGSLVNHGATLTVGEIARAMGYKPNVARAIDTDITLRIAAELRGLTKIMTWGADRPYDKKAMRVPSGWIAPLLVILAVHVEQAGLDGTTVPIEFDAVLGVGNAHHRVLKGGHPSEVG